MRRPSLPAPFLCWTQALDLNPAQARSLWQALDTPDPAAQSALYSLGRLFALAHLPILPRDRCQVHFAGALSPHNLVKIVERAVDDGRLTRREANGIEEAILARTRRDGVWY